MKRILAITLMLLIGTLVSAQLPARQVYSMDKNWKFYFGDPAGAEKTAFNDRNWRTLDVPHDWSVEMAIDENEPAGGRGGYFPTGKGWYRKTFTAPANIAGKQVRLEFDGVHMNSEVWINGRYMGKRPNGYVGFSYDVTPFLSRGRNVIAVRVDNSLQPNSRWYTGSGIYRHVRLVVSNPLHIPQWGVYVTTPEITDSEAVVRVETAVVNKDRIARAASVTSIILDPAGNEAGRVVSAVSLPVGMEDMISQEIRISFPVLWDIDNPRLYTLKSVLASDGGNLLDETLTSFGIRSIQYDADHGFLLNGRKVKMLGVNLHQDGGPVGVAVPAGVWERRLRILKAGGCNAIRTAHNPMATEFYELCDRMGFLVMNEAFDEWQRGKVPEGYSKYFDEWYERDLVSFIHRDRNHPSVVMWSAGNEIGEQHTPDGHKVLENLITVFHREDPTRPVTAGCDHIAADNGPATPEFLNMLDIVGYNYVDRWHERRELFYSIDRHANPQWKMVATESGGLGGERGSYNLGNDPDVVRPDYHFRMIRTEQRWKYTMLYDHVIGDFMWTGIDYYGESRWPGKGAYSGMLDVCGFPKDGYYFHKSHWLRDGDPMIHIFPHWNWEGREGQIMPVLCYTNCEAVELFLNGKSYGEKRLEFPRQGNSKAWNLYDRPLVNGTTADLHLAWDVPYEPGSLKMVGKRAGEVVYTKEVVTTGRPAAVRLTADRHTAGTGFNEVVHLEMEIVDANGNRVPLAGNLIKVEIEGDARVAGMENGNMRDHDSVKTSERKAFNGLCLALVQSGTPGKVRVKVSSEGLVGATTEIEFVKTSGLPAL